MLQLIPDKIFAARVISDAEEEGKFYSFRKFYSPVIIHDTDTNTDTDHDRIGRYHCKIQDEMS